jgi:hypothetical protein
MYNKKVNFERLVAGTAHPSGAPSGFLWVRVTRSFVFCFCVVLCWSLFILLSFGHCVVTRHERWTDLELTYIDTILDKNKEPSWPWSYGNWIYYYLCSQCLSPLTLWVRISIKAGAPSGFLWVRVTRSFVFCFCVVLCWSLFILLSFGHCVVGPFSVADSHYPFGFFKLFWSYNQTSFLCGNHRGWVRLIYTNVQQKSEFWTACYSMSVYQHNLSS